MASSARCRCCPYGFHIDLGFVSFAEDVAKGHTIKRTPTMSRKDRSLLSPLDSLFSDSMENIMSDFEEVLAEKQEKAPSNFEIAKSRLQNGYASDYTGYRIKPPTQSPVPNGNRNGGHELSFATSKPTARTPVSMSGRLTPSAYTALGRTVSEIRARNTESPQPETLPRVGSRVGTPIDLGVSTGSHTMGRRQETEYRDHRNGIDFSHVERPQQLHGAAHQGPVWRRTTPARTEPIKPTEGAPSSTEFASLRRGREVVVNETDTQHRVRYYSASPKMSRKLQPAPPLVTPSQFTYTHQNGHTVLAKTQGTCTSPEPVIVTKEITLQKPVPTEVRSAATSTGPLPPAKPCSECPTLKKELQAAIDRLPPPKPECLSMGCNTDGKFKLEVETKEAGTLSTWECLSIGTGTEEREMTSRGCSPIIFPPNHAEQQTEVVEYVEIGILAETSNLSMAVQTEDTTRKCHFGMNTEPETKAEAKENSEKETMTTRIYYRNIPSQTEQVEEETQKKVEVEECSSNAASSSEMGCQTDYEHDNSLPRVLEDSEMTESLWLMPAKETAEAAVGPDGTETQGDIPIPTECQTCLSREQTFGRNVGVGSCSINDKVCLSCDNSIDEVDENDAPGFKLAPESLKPKQLDSSRVAAVKKLLTSEQKQNFVRGTAVTKSARLERKKGDDLDYIEQKNKSATLSTPSSTPSDSNTDALKSKVVLKKEIPLPPSNVPDPIPARIPRPKISKYATPEENAATADEEDEASDRLTPLRSELRTLGRWPRGSLPIKYDESKIEEDDSGEDSDGSEGSYCTNEDPQMDDDTPFEISPVLHEALESLNSHLLQPGSVTSATADWALKYVQHEWLRTTARKSSRSEHVEVLVEQLKELGPAILKTVVNISDQNGNTALHYAVSHGNFSVVSSLLDSGECQLNLSNRAGYTAVMLAALSSLEDETERTVVQRLFEMGDVNARASQHGQTALMLAVSHGKKDATQLLLNCKADVNLQDEEGSTALMCAAEHGHKELVKLLLAQKEIDAALTDCDNSTALSIAVENDHRDIGVLIYAFLNYTKNEALDENQN